MMTSKMVMSVKGLLTCDISLDASFDYSMAIAERSVMVSVVVYYHH